MLSVTVTLGTLIDRTLTHLQDASALPWSTVLQTLTDISGSTAEITVSDASGIQVSDVLELGAELFLVTAKSAAATPVVTVSRGYYGSTVATHTVGSDLVYVNPRYPRVRVAEAIRRSFGRLESLGLPMVMASTMTRATDKKYIALPDGVRDVLAAGYVADDGRYWELDGWRVLDGLPTSKFSTGKVLRLPRYIQNTDDVEVTYRTPYRWSTHPAVPDEAATISMHEGSEDLPALYASCWLLASREIARTDISRAEEWNQGEPSRDGVSASVLRLQWQEFYRALDEARRLVPTMPIHRQYVRMPRFTK